MTNDKSVAIVTPSFAADFDRCRLLCDSIDANVKGVADHFILVDDDDYTLFSQLTGARRQVINERDILPDWLHMIPGGVGAGARKLWISSRNWPMRGWHVQQLRRIAIAAHIEHEALLYCDSDMFFVRPFDLAMLWRQKALRLYRVPDGISKDMTGHKKWPDVAYRLNGLASQSFPHHDYINNLVSWRRETVLAMCRHIEKVTGRDWLSAIGRNRTFSECLIYGVYADRIVADEAVHWRTNKALCLTYWDGEALEPGSLRRLVERMDHQQYALGIQSFTNTDTGMLRRFLEEVA